MIFPLQRSCKIIIQSDVVGNILTLVDDADETWSQLCQRTVEKDYLLSHRRLLPLLVRIHPGKRLVAYRLRYDMGHGTIIKPTWSQRAKDHDGVHEEVPVGEAFVDVNVSLRQSSRAAPEFEPHESIFASLGAEGVERTTFVTLHCEIIGVDGENGACPFPVTRELTRVLSCNEHERFPGCIDGHEFSEEVSDDMYACSLSGKCMNTCMAEDGYEVMIRKTALPNLNMDEECGVKNAQGKRADEDAKKDICLIEDMERNCTAVGDATYKTRRMKKRTNEELNQVSVSMGEVVEQAGVAESTIDKQMIPSGIVISVDGAAATGEEKTRTLKKEQPIPFQISKASPTASTSASAAGAIPWYSGEEVAVTSALYGRLVADDSAPDSGGSATEAADKSCEKAASINNTGCAAYPSGKTDGHKAMQITGTQLSGMEPSSEKAVTAAADVDPSLGNEKISNEPVKRTSSAKSNDGTSISRASKFLAIRRINGKQSQGNKKIFASQPVAAEPAIGLPPGWTTRRIPRVGSAHTDCRYFSPKLDYLFRTKKETQRFLKFLKEANGDEEEAMLSFRPTGQGMTQAAVTGGTFDNRVNNDQDVDSNSKMAMAAATKTNRKRKTNATKKALQDLASGKEDESSTTSLIVEHEQPSRKKANIMTEKIAQEIKSHIKKGDTSRKKKLANPTQPKKPPSAYMLFYRSALPKLISDHPDLKPAEVRKQLSDAYKSIGQDELKHYQNEAAVAMKEYELIFGDLTQQNVGSI